MSRRLQLGLVFIVILANAGATCLYSGAGPAGQSPAAMPTPWNPGLDFLARSLTLPIPTAGIVDVRDVALIFSLGLALLIVAVGGWGTALRAALPCGWRLNGAAERWLLITAAGVAALAFVSALVNRSLDLSWGWIVRFIAGAGWAMLLARFLSGKQRRIVVLALLGVALVAMVLTIWHRADRGLAYFTWPVGPITTIGALAAVWATMGIGHAVASASTRRLGAAAVFAAVVGLLAVYVLIETGRRAPALGLVFGLAAVGIVVLRLRWSSRIIRVTASAAFIICLVGAAAYVVSQARSPSRQKAGSLALRFEYWRLSAELFLRRPLLGWGPDTFVVHMTTKVAPLRAYSPHLYHGNIDPYAHNEWLQAAVELGAPAALVYLAMPLGAVALALRRTSSAAGSGQSMTGSPPDYAVTASLVAGLIAIVVLDAGSITMRTPIMPVWYWTLVGLLFVRPEPALQNQAEPSASSRHHRTFAVAAVGGAIACFAVTWLDVSHAAAEASPVVRPKAFQTVRLLGEKTILARDHNAVLAEEAAHLAPSADRIALAKSLWRWLYELIPGYQDIPARYADVLILAGNTDEARGVLDFGLSAQISPFNVDANLLYASFITSDPVVRLRCVQRSLRSGPLNDRPQRILDQIISQPTAMEALRHELPRARLIAQGEPGESAADATVELLRINAYVMERSGSLAEAISDQRLAAGVYRRLEQAEDRYRRRSEAETDAFFQLARLLYAADHVDYAAAYAAIVAAERYAVLGIAHESVARPRPEEGFIGGEIIPMEFPERLRPMWRLSAFLHVVAGHEQHLIERVLSSLPPEQWTDADLRRELAAIYRRADDDLGRLPPQERPAHYAQIREIAERSAATTRPSSYNRAP